LSPNIRSWRWASPPGVILLLEGLQQVNKWQENWILYRSTCEGLRNEQHHYNEKSGAKLTPEEAHRVLAECVGALASAEHSKWITGHREKVEMPAGTKPTRRFAPLRRGWLLWRLPV
jgi:hypothetical protein